MNIAPDYPDYTYPEYCAWKREQEMSNRLVTRLKYDVTCTTCHTVKRVSEGDVVLETCSKCGSTVLTVEEVD